METLIKDFDFLKKLTDKQLEERLDIIREKIEAAKELPDYKLSENFKRLDLQENLIVDEMIERFNLKK